MLQKTVVLLLAVLTGLLAFQTFGTPREGWSYAIMAPKDFEFVEVLNKAGALGWEVVSARRAVDGEGRLTTSSYEMILKRRGIGGVLPQLGLQ